MNMKSSYSKHAKQLSSAHFALLLLCLGLLNACTSILPAGSAPPSIYSLDTGVAAADSAQQAKAGAPTLILGLPRAVPGFDTQRMMYLREPHKLEYFRLSEWANPPAAMLAPLAAAALERNGAFAAVVQAPTSAHGQFRLELEIVRLQQEFLTSPSREHFTLLAHLLDTDTRQVIAWREFDAVVPAPSDDPYGGVVAANQAVRTVLTGLAAFCADAVSNARLSHPVAAHDAVRTE